MVKEVYIVGAGTYGEATCELAETLGFNVIGFYDEDEIKLNTYVMNHRVLGKFSDLTREDIKNKNFIVAIGNNKVRFNIMEKINKLGGFLPNLIHPSAAVSPSAKLGKGVYIQANAYICTKA